ncbi:MAG TPA: TRAP transporter small permease subunit [Devosia sp.]|uniref:TRAP transporter small permease subunit n=1 Tax=Devosia sp. TaxID=1871048 RepID=UPI002DDD361B|nr:TRAP transporter small permease subunit [Devosia sp.]HEV2516391.1 TRAP transporter small permease subunit [Devosia sp.]
MPKPIRMFVHFVDRLNLWVGRFAMLLFYVLAGVLLTSTLSRLFFGAPVNWALEMSQFILSAYYLLGGAYTLQRHGHVRMDLFWSRLPPERRAGLDAFTALFVMFYLGVMIWGGVSSTSYAITYGQKNYSAWAPVLWPVKTVMTIGLFLMLLQFIANFFRDIAASRGKTI